MKKRRRQLSVEKVSAQYKVLPIVSLKSLSLSEKPFAPLMEI
jgi:hypothetical protein